jgi:NAD(P)-dependent dehydrogenase (short-subunit alcohol dehydrogenase family)
MDFENRVAMVTGGTGALGTAVTMDLLRAGARVAVTYMDEGEWVALKGLAAEHRDRLVGTRVDLMKASQAEAFVAEIAGRWQRVDFLVCAAGGFAAGKSYESDEQTWDKMFNLNLRTVVVCLRAVVPQMIRRNFGRVVTVSSGAILRGGGAGIAAYAVSKGAVRQLTEILADEVRNYDICAHSIMPGTMDTEANRRSMPQADFSKWVKTEEVARVIHWLLSDDTRAVRSVVVPVLG